MQLFRSLLRLICLAAGDPVPGPVVEALRRAGPAAWRRALSDLRGHRLAPLLALELRRRGLEELVDPVIRSQLVESYQATLLANTVQVHAQAQILAALSRRGITPVVFKGLLLADRYYPDLGTRPMVDIDLLVSPEETPHADAILQELGYELRPQSGCFHHPSIGAEVDLHHAFVLYPPAIRAGLIERVEPQRLQVDRLTTWEPNALLMHLVVHLGDHRRRDGVVLVWILDVAFVVRAVADRLSIEALRALAPRERYLTLLWRILRFLEVECGVAPPVAFRHEVSRHRSLSLPRILRQRRLRPWGFPHPRFPRRLLSAGLGLRTRGPREWPRWSDVPLGLIDCLVDRGVCG